MCGEQVFNVHVYIHIAYSKGASWFAVSRFANRATAGCKRTAFGHLYGIFTSSHSYSLCDHAELDLLQDPKWGQKVLRLP